MDEKAGNKPRRCEELIHDGYRHVFMQDFNTINTLVRPDAVVRSAKDMLLMQTLKGSVSFTLTALNQQGKRQRVATGTNAQESELHDSTEWQRFLRDFVDNLLDFGIVVVQRVVDAVHRTLLPGVLHYSQFELWFRRLPGRSIEFCASWINLTEAEQRLGGVNNNEVIEDALILSLYDPTPDGRLSSPSSAAIPIVHHLLRYWNDFAYSSYWRAHPVYPIQRDPRVNNPDPAELLVGPSIDDLGKKAEKRRSEEHSVRVRIVNNMVNQGMETNARRVQQLRADPAFEANTKDISLMREQVATCQNPAAFTPPFCMALPLETGESVGTAPLPVTHSDALNAILLRSKEIYSCYKIPSQMTPFDHSSHVADSQLALSEFNQSIQQFQRSLEPLLADVYEFVYSMALQQLENLFVKTHMEKLKSSTEIVVQHSAKKRTAPSLRSDGQIDDSMELAIRNVFRGSHSIQATLHYHPMTSYESMRAAFIDGLIDLEGFRKHAPPLLGIPRSDVSTEALPNARLYGLNPHAAVLSPQNSGSLGVNK